MFEDVWAPGVIGDVGLDDGGKGGLWVGVEVVVDACLCGVVGVLEESGLEIRSGRGGEEGEVRGGGGEEGEDAVGYGLDAHRVIIDDYLN